MRPKMTFLLWAFLVLSLLIALNTGRYPIGPGDMLHLVLGPLGLAKGSDAVAPEMAAIFWNIRLPRIVLSFVVGAGMAMAGVVFQALFRNPLAAPDILGVTAGSCFGAALAIMLFAHWALGVQGMAFIGGVVAVGLAYLLASRSWDRSAAVLVISGIVTSAVFQAGLSILMYLANPYDQLAKIVFWVMGSFHAASWDRVQSTLPVVGVGAVALLVFSWRLNVMTHDEEEALSLGIDVFRWRLFYVVTATLMVASSVAAVGTISWVGLIIPHIARYLVGTEHTRLIRTAGLLGGSFLVLMDSLARSMLASEIPISIVTSIFGAPFLAYLVISRSPVGMDARSRS